MSKNKNLFKLIISLLLLFGFYQPVLAVVTDFTVTLSPADATNFTSTPSYNPGAGECELTWVSSTTPNITNQEIYVDDGSTITSHSVAFPGPSLGMPPASPLVITGLIPGWTYILRHVSEAGTLESSGVWTTCTPAIALPAPVMDPEPATTEGTSNTVYWTNGGVDDATMECNVQISTTDLNVDPLSYDQESGWQPCTSSTTTYDHTFTGLATGTTYFYHVQSRTPADGLSPFSNVVYSQQIDSGYTPPDDGGGGAGGRPPADPDPDPVCGNGILEEGEQCDDGNNVSGDGCSATCDIEHEAPEEQVCGNGIVEEGEECDDGNTVSGDGCDAVCMLEDEPVCGNGILEEGEQCDDGNLINGDGCSDTCELEVVPVTFEIKGKPEFRVERATHPNLSLNSEFLVHKPSIANTDSVQIKLDDFGNATYEGEIITGTYDFGLNGEAHNTKVIRGIEITSETQVVTLDFTYADTAALIAGDIVDNNYINGVDMSKLIQQYRMEGTEVLSDLNKEGYVNGIDASIVITNYRKQGESF